MVGIHEVVSSTRTSYVEIKMICFKRCTHRSFQNTKSNITHTVYLFCECSTRDLACLATNRDNDVARLSASCPTDYNARNCVARDNRALGPLDWRNLSWYALNLKPNPLAMVSVCHGIVSLSLRQSTSLWWFLDHCIGKTYTCSVLNFFM